MANEQEITFDEPDEGRDIYHEPDDRALIRTKDVYQTELDNGVEGYSVFVKVGFKSRGCLAMTGCASAICSMIEGKTFSQALELTPKDVEAAVDGVPKGKGHTTLFAIEAVRGLVGDWMYRCGMPLAEMDEKLPCDEMSVACLMCEHCSLRDTRVEMRVNEVIAKQKAGEAK